MVSYVGFIDERFVEVDQWCQENAGLAWDNQWDGVYKTRGLNNLIYNFFQEQHAISFRLRWSDLIEETSVKDLYPKAKCC